MHVVVPVVALKCYKCVNLKSDSSVISSNLNPSCEDVDSSTGSVTCDSYDSCVYADVTATVNTLFGKPLFFSLFCHGPP